MQSIITSLHVIMTQDMYAENIYISHCLENNMNISSSQGFYKILCSCCISDLLTYYLSAIAITNKQFFKLTYKSLGSRLL